MQNIGFYIFNMVVFFVFVISQNTEIVIVSNFWLGMYRVSNGEVWKLINWYFVKNKGIGSMDFTSEVSFLFYVHILRKKIFI